MQSWNISHVESQISQCDGALINYLVLRLRGASLNNSNVPCGNQCFTRNAVLTLKGEDREVCSVPSNYTFLHSSDFNLYSMFVLSHTYGDISLQWGLWVLLKTCWNRNRRSFWESLKLTVRVGGSLLCSQIPCLHSFHCAGFCRQAANASPAELSLQPPWSLSKPLSFSF